MHSSRFLLRYDHTRQPYHVRDEISLDDEKSNRRGSSLGIVTATSMTKEFWSAPASLLNIRERRVKAHRRDLHVHADGEYNIDGLRR